MEIKEGTLINGRYVIQRRCGSGGFATVYRALDEHLKQRPVALKILNADRASQEHARFNKEIRALARVVHPNVVTIFDEGTFEGHAYYTMESLGGSLRDILKPKKGNGDRRARRLPWPFVHGLLLQIAYGLRAIHQSNIIHRDLKPENVLLYDLEQGPMVAKIADFGLAKLLNTNVTVTADPRLGTPLYMPPELLKTPDMPADPDGQHLLDSASDSSTAPDLYALGIVAYELLTGYPPFYKKGIKLTLFVMHRINTEIRYLSELVPKIPPDTSVMLSRCVRRDPSERPTSVDELIAVLQKEAPTFSICDITPDVEARQESVAISSPYGTSFLDILYLEPIQAAFHPAPGCSFNISRVGDRLCIEVDKPTALVGKGKERKLMLVSAPGTEGHFDIRWKRPRDSHEYHYSCGTQHGTGGLRYFSIPDQSFHRFSLFLRAGAFAVLLTSLELARPVLLVAP